MQKLITAILFLLSVLAGFSQENIDIEWITVPKKFDSIVMSNDFKLVRCKNSLSDSLSTLLSSFQNPVHSTTYDTTIQYSYQFTKVVDIEIDFQSKLSHQKECFVIENERNSSIFFESDKFITYDKNEWLVLVIEGIPRIGNSTYISESHLYFRRN
jgi:hypothetical protein